MENPTPILAEKIYHSSQLNQAWKVFSEGGIIPIADGFSLEVRILPNSFKAVRVLFTPKGYSQPKELAFASQVRKEQKQNKLDTVVKEGGDLF